MKNPAMRQLSPEKVAGLLLVYWTAHLRLNTTGMMIMNIEDSGTYHSDFDDQAQKQSSLFEGDSAQNHTAFGVL